MVGDRCPLPQEIRSAGPVFVHPLLCKLARLDLVENRTHLGLGLIGDDAGPAGDVAVFGRVGDGVTHPGDATFEEQVHD